MNTLQYTFCSLQKSHIIFPLGPVIRAETLMSAGRPKGAGLVRFEDYQACERAIGK
jgi:hypothetical protein